MSEIEELLEEGKVLERRLTRIRQRLLLLSKMMELEIDIDKWRVNNGCRK